MTLTPLAFYAFAILLSVRPAAAVDPGAAPWGGSQTAAPAGVAETLHLMEEARSLRWCGMTQGLPESVVEGSADEARLVDMIARASSNPGEISDAAAAAAAAALIRGGKYADGLRLLDACIAEGARGTRGSSQDAALMRALCLDRMGRRAEAAEAYGTYEARRGLLGDYALLLGSRCLARGGRSEQGGVDFLDRLVTRWRHSPLWGEAALELCGRYREAHRYADCIELAGTVSRETRGGSGKRTALYLMARAMEESDRSAEAEPIYWRIVRDYPAHRKAGVAFRALRRLVGARGGELTPEQMYHGAVALSNTGNTREAYEAFDELAARGAGSPYWGEAVRDMAGISYRTRRYADAVELYERLADAGEMSPDEARLWMGKCWIRSGKEERAFEILKEVGGGRGARSVRAEALWETGREMESLGRAEEAAEVYRFIADSLADAPLAQSSCFRLGFCLYLVDELEGAIDALNAAWNLSSANHQKAQARYWEAKALEREGRTGEAEEALKEAASYGPGVYYGARAAWVLDTGMHELRDQEFAPSRSPGPADTAGGGVGRHACAGAPPGYPGRGAISSIADPAVDPAGWHLCRGFRLLQWGDLDMGAREIREAMESGYGKKDAVDALVFYGAYSQAMRIAGDAPPQHIYGSGDGDAYVAFPLGFAKTVWRRGAELGIDPFLSLAVIRQESRFDPDAVSWAGAYGLMQLMPTTAKRHAAKAGVRWKGPSQILDPETNVRFGTMELHDLFEELGKLPVVLSAYNAGPAKAKEWAALADGVDLDSYIEMIGYSQTRDYVKLVIRDYLAFLRLYDPSWGPQ
jgi:tetratricopeptide (TPR) repeat protein